ncbi:hypothetical protein [Paraburkholderia bannensis]|uniref:hypothetical protein n=1 Tax=Paraburkholderia bannensis TaxID=765414 RepID=UPI002AB0C9CC|nr:hypothetical protein [Paraburkholderia bannensis]
MESTALHRRDAATRVEPRLRPEIILQSNHEFCTAEMLTRGLQRCKASIPLKRSGKTPLARVRFESQDFLCAKGTESHCNSCGMKRTLKIPQCRQALRSIQTPV